MNFKGDSFEYKVFEDSIKLLTKPLGHSVEIGVRRGLGSKCIIDAFRKHHQDVKVYHLGIDPYGQIPYKTSEQKILNQTDYSNDMKRSTLIEFCKYYPEFILVQLEDFEFFNRYPDGYPVYDHSKKYINQYDIVHFDGPHDNESVKISTEFFNNRKSDECIFVYDDIKNYDHDITHNYLLNLGFDNIFYGERKAVYFYR